MVQNLKTKILGLIFSLIDNPQLKFINHSFISIINSTFLCLQELKKNISRL